MALNKVFLKGFKRYSLFFTLTIAHLLPVKVFFGGFLRDNEAGFGGAEGPLGAFFLAFF